MNPWKGAWEIELGEPSSESGTRKVSPRSQDQRPGPGEMCVARPALRVMPGLSPSPVLLHPHEPQSLQPVLVHSEVAVHTQREHPRPSLGWGKPSCICPRVRAGWDHVGMSGMLGGNGGSDGSFAMGWDGAATALTVSQIGLVNVPPPLGTEPRGDSPHTRSPHGPAVLSRRTSGPCQRTRISLELAMGSCGVGPAMQTHTGDFN